MSNVDLYHRGIKRMRRGVRNVETRAKYADGNGRREAHQQARSEKKAARPNVVGARKDTVEFKRRVSDLRMADQIDFGREITRHMFEKDAKKRTR